MKKIFLFALCLLFLPLTTKGQDTKSILDKAVAIFERSSGLQADFDVTIYKGSQKQGNTQGTIFVKKEKFHISTPLLLAWFDGKTQWMLLKNSDEVNVTTPTKDEIQKNNPYSYIYIYKNGYQLSHQTSNYNNRKCYKVKLKAKNHQQKIKEVNLILDANSYLPLSINIVEDKNMNTHIKVWNVKNNQKFNDSLFEFKKKDYPNIEVIDLR